MGAPPLTTHKPVWMHRADEENLDKLKHLMGLRDSKGTVTIPDAIGEALRIAVAELDPVRNGAFPRQGAPGPRSWEPGHEIPEGTPVFGPFTTREETE